MTDCTELLGSLELAGNVQVGIWGTSWHTPFVQDLVAISPTAMVASYQMRTMAEQAAFALDGLTLASGNQIAISLYFPQNDPQVG